MFFGQTSNPLFSSLAVTGLLCLFAYFGFVQEPEVVALPETSATHIQKQKNAPCSMQNACEETANQLGHDFAAIMGITHHRNILQGKYNASTHPVKDWRPTDGFKVSRALLHAIMHQESRFKPTARSHAGAYGVMQIMPDTATYIINKKRLNEIQVAALQPVRVPNISPRTMHKPEVNMTVGQAYMQYLAEKPYIKGSLVKLLAAYNAGPGKVLEWEKRFGSISDAEFARSIPYKETREYVQKVMANYWVYSGLLGEMPSLSLSPYRG